MKIGLKILILAVLFGGFFYEADAQTSRRRTANRRRTPVSRPAPVTGSQRIIEPEVVSTAEEGTGEENNGDTQTTNSAARARNRRRQNAGTQTQNTGDDNGALSREVTTLRGEVRQLKEKRGVEDLEKLSLAEERAESFRRKLEETIGRETALNTKLQELELQSRPEMIERETAGIGSLRPEEVRDARRKSLENEKRQIKEQINQASISRSRLETAVANADSLVERLRARVDAGMDEEIKAGKSAVQSKDADKKQTADDDDEDNPQ